VSVRVARAALSLALAFAGALAAAPLPAGAVVVDRVAAVVNDDVITLSEVYELGGDFIEQRASAPGGDDAVRREVELEVLDSLILRRLISQEIVKMGLEVTDVELDRTIDDIAGRNQIDRDQLRAEIEKGGLSWSDYREEVRESLRGYKFNEAIIRPRIAVDENELLDAYKRTIASEDRPVNAELGAIFFTLAPGSDDDAKAAVVQRAEAARARVDGGEAFSAVATELDEGLYGAQGGRMGTYSQGELVAVLNDVAFALEPGEVSAPVVTPQGVFVLTVFTRTVQEPVSFDEARDQLFEEVYAGRIEEETDQWYRQARRRAAVLVKLPTPGG